MKKETESLAKAIANSLEIPSEIAYLLANRGFDTEEKIYDLYLKDKELSNPFLLPGMKAGAIRIAQAIKQDEKIVIYGDYDVDGMLASIILYSYIKQAKANVEIYIPDREQNGYGMTKDQLEKIKFEKEADLVISVDNGTSAIEALAYAKEINLDVIVTDHHEPLNGQLPETVALINPKIMTKDSDLKSLCGAGIAFYIVRALNSIMYEQGKKKPALTDYLVLAALATIADMVPMVSDNRIIVDKGLELLYQTDILGLNLLLNKIYIPHYPSAKDLGFSLIPVLNSAARMGETFKTINVLTEKNLIVEKSVNDLIKLNAERKKISDEASKQAFILAEKEDPQSRILIIKSPEFHIGMIGLIANKVAEKYKKTVIIVSSSNEKEWKASVRSSENIDLTKIVNLAKDTLLKGGGHKSAVGLSIIPEKFSEFNQIIQKNEKEILQKIGDSADFSPELEIKASNLNDNLVKHFYLLEPFGQNNATPNVEVSEIQKFISTDTSSTKTIKFRINKYLDVIYYKPSDEQFALYRQIVDNSLKFSLVGEIMSNGDKLILQATKIILSH